MQRRVPRMVSVMVAGQRLRVGRTHAGTIVTVVVEDHHFRVLDGASQNSHCTPAPRPNPSETSTPLATNSGKPCPDNNASPMSRDHRSAAPSDGQRGTVAGKSLAASIHRTTPGCSTPIQAHDKRMRELLDAHPDTPDLHQFPGIGPVIAAVLISGMGGEARTLASGLYSPRLDWHRSPKASGVARQVRFPRTPPTARWDLIDWWMFVAVREDPWSADTYQQARAAGNPSPSTARPQCRWVRIRGVAGETAPSATRTILPSRRPWRNPAIHLPSENRGQSRRSNPPSVEG